MPNVALFRKRKASRKRNPEKTSVFHHCLNQILQSRIRSKTFFFTCFTKLHIRVHHNSGCKDKDLLAYFEYVS